MDGMNFNEPWEFERYDCGLAHTWLGGEPEEPASVSSPSFRHGEPFLYASLELDAKTQNAIVRRVVACVNACEGIPTAELEGVSQPHLIETIWGMM